MADGVFSEDLTPDEAAYFESRGENQASEAPAEPSPVESPVESAPSTPENPPETPVSDEISADSDLETSVSESGTEEKAGSVPIWALKEARERAKTLAAERKAVEEQLAVEREARVRLEERFAALERTATPAPEPPPPLPDPEIDPLGYEQMRREELEREVYNLKHAVASTRMETEIGWINNQTAQLTQQFAARNPDYEEALNYVKERRREQIQLLYPTAAPQQVEEQVALEYGNIVRESLERMPNGSIRFRRVPAEAVYAMAKSMGFQSAPPPAPVEDSTIAPEARIEQTRRRAAAASSLSAVSGGEGSAPLDAKRLAQMSETDFAKLMREKPDLVNKLMGA